MSLAWWRDVWASPMAARYVDADVHALYIVLELLEAFWRHPSGRLAREIRLGSQPFGLNPLDRRRLQWEIEQTKDQARRTPQAPTPTKRTEDPRKVLQMVKR